MHIKTIDIDTKKSIIVSVKGKWFKQMEVLEMEYAIGYMVFAIVACKTWNDFVNIF